MLFADVAGYFSRLEATSSRNKMVEILAELFGAAGAGELDRLIYLTQGRVGPAFEKVEFGVGEALAAEAIARAAQAPRAEVKAAFAELGDYGLVAERLLPAEAPSLPVVEVFDRLRAVAGEAGQGSQTRKVDLLAELLGQVSAAEARHLMRIPLGQARLGVGDPTMLDALSFATAGDKSLRKTLERAYNLCSDLGQVARALRSGGVPAVEAIGVQVGNPVRSALAERANSAEEIVRRLGQCAVEPKLDGFRAQVHRDGDTVRVFSRNLEDFSEMFPEIAEAARTRLTSETAIFEGEAIAYDAGTGEYLPFQVTVQRRRKHGIEAMQQQVPLRLSAFDLLYVGGEDITGEPWHERRRRLEALIRPDETLTVNDRIVTDDSAELDAYFNDTVSRGLEGILAKRLDAPYQAGARNFNWIKLKRAYQGHLQDTVDCVVVGYWYGRGARAQFGIGSLLTAVYDRDADTFRTVARLGSGLSEVGWLEMRQRLDALAIPHRPARLESLVEPDVWTEPKWVVEIQADEITRSPVHTAGRTETELGFALRFPRLRSIRDADRDPESATTVTEIAEMYAAQTSRATRTQPEDEG